MGSPFYDKLLGTVSRYVDANKAEGVLSRQLPKCSANENNFTQAHLKAILPAVTGALSLYVTDVGLREEMVAKIKALA